MPNAQAYLATAIGGGQDGTIVLWTSSEVQASAFALPDYLGNGDISRLVASGEGTFTASLLHNFGGTIVQREITGTYDVTAKCFVSLKYQDGGVAHSAVGALGGRGDSAMMMVTTPGAAVSGVFRSQQ